MPFRARVKTASGWRSYAFKSESVYHRRYTKKGYPRAAQQKRTERRRAGKTDSVFRVSVVLYPEEYEDGIEFRAWGYANTQSDANDLEDELLDYLSNRVSTTSLFFAAREGKITMKEGVENRKVSRGEMDGEEVGKRYAKARIKSPSKGITYEYDKGAIDGWKFNAKTRNPKGRAKKMRSLLEW